MNFPRRWLRPILILTGLFLLAPLATNLVAHLTTRGLRPNQDWVAAIQAGGTVLLGPGKFSTDRTIEVTRSITITGAGSSKTTLLLDSDDGEYGEQFAIVAPGPAEVRVIISDLTFVHGGTYMSDLVTAAGRAHVELRDVGINLTYFTVRQLFQGNGIGSGCGVLVTPGASLSVEAGSFHGNLHGICGTGASQVSVAGSSFVDNLQAGI